MVGLQPNLQEGGGGGIGEGGGVGAQLAGWAISGSHRRSFRATFVASWGLLAGLGQVFDAAWAHFGPSPVPIGGCFGPPLGLHGVSWRVSALPYHDRASFRRHLGPLWAISGSHRRSFRATFGASWGLLAVLGPALAGFRRHLGPLLAIFGSHRRSFWKALVVLGYLGSPRNTWGSIGIPGHLLESLVILWAGKPLRILESEDKNPIRLRVFGE